MNTELALLKLLYNYNNYINYNIYIKDKFIKDNNKELHKCFLVLKHYHEKNQETVASPEALALLHSSLYPGASDEEQQACSDIFHAADGVKIPDGVAKEVLEAHRNRVKAVELSLLGLEVSEGRKPYEALLEASTQLLEGSDGGLEEEEEFVTASLSQIHEIYTKPGLKWPLKTLNQMLGSLRKGDFGFIFARPETGKTTFLAHMATYMAPQLADQPILWVNNEEAGMKVKLRCIQSFFGVTTEQLWAKLGTYEAEYEKLVGQKIKIYDKATVTQADVDRLCRKYQPGLIIFDQLDKVGSSKTERYDLEMKALYKWAREIAKKYGPVVAVCQAGGSGEGKRWLTMDDVDSSKTAKQGEADWILGIGKAEMDSVRHLHLPKNKFIAEPGTVAELRHGKMDVIILPELGRYKDVGDD